MMNLINNTNSLLKKPRLTIGLGVYNDSKYLSGALDGLLSQTFADFDLIISDNASNDETPDILKQYAKKDSRIRIFHQSENIGLVRNFNFLVKQGHGEYFMWAACDDRWSPTYVETIISGMDKDPNIIIGFTPYQFINEDGEPFGLKRVFDYSGKTAFFRLMRFFAIYDDGITYGIFRYSAIKDYEIPIWWWLNKNTPLNSAYALITYILAKGQIRLFGTEPLWFNCIKTTTHFEPFRKKQNKILYLSFFILRKINLVAVQFKDIWHGSNNLFLGIIFFPVLVVRAIADLTILVNKAIRKRINKDSNLHTV
jgi:glycosyltransferase involved in cell wall biosynthesis